MLGPDGTDDGWVIRRNRGAGAERGLHQTGSASASAASAATAAHCHSEWISAQPRACSTAGDSQLLSPVIVVFLVRIQDAAEFFDLLR